MNLESSLQPGQVTAVLSSTVQTALGTVSADDLEKSVRELAYPRHFTAESEANRRAGDYLADRLRTLGYRVVIQGESRNVIATRGDVRSGASRSPLTLVGAHYDSVAESPGADDNASAVAALLGCATAAAAFLPDDAPVCFVAFNREEVQTSGEGLVGSSEFVTEYLPTAGFKVGAAHILEMVGCTTSIPGGQATPPGLPVALPNPGDWLGVVGDHRSRSLIDDVLMCARTYLPRFGVLALSLPAGAEVLLPVLCRSDHAPFWAAGIPALQWTDTAEFRNPRYHGEADTPDTLDYAFLSAVTRLAAACLLERCGVR